MTLKKNRMWKNPNLDPVPDPHEKLDPNHSYFFTALDFFPRIIMMHFLAELVKIFEILKRRFFKFFIDFKSKQCDTVCTRILVLYNKSLYNKEQDFWDIQY